MEVDLATEEAMDTEEDLVMEVEVSAMVASLESSTDSHQPLIMHSTQIHQTRANQSARNAGKQRTVQRPEILWE